MWVDDELARRRPVRSLDQLISRWPDLDGSSAAAATHSIRVRRSIQAIMVISSSTTVNNIPAAVPAGSRRVRTPVPSSEHAAERRAGKQAHVPPRALLSFGHGGSTLDIIARELTCHVEKRGDTVEKKLYARTAVKPIVFSFMK